MKSYKLFWDEFSAWYLEIIKPEYLKPVDSKTYKATISIFEKLMHLIHPFMPFISEEIWQLLVERKDGESLMISLMPEHKKYNKLLVGKFETTKEVISSIRTVRKEKNIPQKENIDLYIKTDADYDRYFIPIMKKLCNLSNITFTDSKVEAAASFLSGTVEYFIPLGHLLDREGELAKAEEELNYAMGFLDSVMKKLGNERFVQNAPENVIGTERKKKADTESKIKSLKEKIIQLRKI
jgi:valyl-tRNA synthetase